MRDIMGAIGVVVASQGAPAAHFGLGQKVPFKVPTCPEGMALTAKAGKCVCVTPGPLVKAYGLPFKGSGGGFFK